MDSDSQIEKILMKDDLYKKHFVKKHPPLHSEEYRIDYSYFENTQSAKKALDYIKEYLKFPLIEDNFSLGDEKEDKPRDLIQRELSEKYGEEAHFFFIRNKLRGNCENQLLSAISLLQFFLKRKNEAFSEKARQVAIMIESMGVNYSKYKKMDIGERINLIRDIEDRTYRMLKSIER